MSPFEIFFVILIAGAALLGFRSGLVKQIGSLAGIIVAIIACRIFGPQLADYWTGSAQGASDQAVYYLLAYAVVGIVAYLAVLLVARVVRGIIHGICLGAIDRLAGAVFKVFEWLLVCSLVYNIWVVFRPSAAPEEKDVWAERLLSLAPTVIGSETAQDLIHGIGNAMKGNQ